MLPLLAGRFHCRPGGGDRTALGPQVLQARGRLHSSCESRPYQPFLLLRSDLEAFPTLALAQTSDPTSLQIPITAFVKLIGTRWFDKLMNEIDELEIDLVCGEGDVSPDLSVPLTEQDVDVRLKPSELASTMKSFVTT